MPLSVTQKNRHARKYILLPDTEDPTWLGEASKGMGPGCYWVVVLVTQSCPTLRPHGANQAPLSLGFSRQEHWSGLPFLSLGDLPNPRIESRSPALQAESLPSNPPRKPKNLLPSSISKRFYPIFFSKGFLIFYFRFKPSIPFGGLILVSNVRFRSKFIF